MKASRGAAVLGSRMVAVVGIPVFMSVEEFMAWEPGDGRSWQLVDGVLQAVAPTNRTHGVLQGRLAFLLEAHFERSGSPCSVVITPGVVPHVQAGYNVRIPDLSVTCSPYRDLLALYGRAVCPGRSRAAG